MQYKVNSDIVELLSERETTRLEAYLYLTTLEERVSLSSLAQRWHWNISKVSRFLKLLSDNGHIKCDTDRGGTFIELLDDTPKKKPTKSIVKVEGQVQLLNQQWYDAGSLTPAQKKEAALVIRKKQFWVEMQPFFQQYPDCQEELRKFFLWATEPNKSKTKMKMETYTTWDTSLRINNWLNSNKNGNRTYLTRAEQNDRNSQRRDISIATDIQTTGADAAAQRMAELKAQGVI